MIVTLNSRSRPLLEGGDPLPDGTGALFEPNPLRFGAGELPGKTSPPEPELPGKLSPPEPELPTPSVNTCRPLMPSAVSTWTVTLA